MSKCYDTAIELVNEMSRRLGEMYKVSGRKMSIFKETCEAIEQLSDDLMSDVLDVNVIGDGNDLVFTLISDDITLDSDELMESFVNVVPMVDSIRFSKAKYEDKKTVKLRTDLAINRLWVAADE